MAKQKDLTPVQKGKAEFNLVGKAKRSDFTFKLDVESQKSDWIYNQLNLGVDCGTGVFYADMMGGYGADRDNVVYVHGVKENDNGNKVDDWKNSFTIDWEDRLDESNYDVIGDSCFLTVGLEKDTKDKTVYKKFLSAYDAIVYIDEVLEDGMVINVKGSLKYQKYNDNYITKKEISSIVLSKAEEKDFKATFVQTILVDKDSIGKADKETRTVPITASLVEYCTEFNGDKIEFVKDGKKKKGVNLPITRTFDFKVGEDKEKAQKILKQFKSKKGITELTVDGYFSKGDLNTVEVTEDDIPDDIKELIELGLIDEEEVKGKIAFANGGNKPEKMIIKAPHIDMKEVDGKKIPSLAKVENKYTEDDINPFLIVEMLGIETNDEEDLDRALDTEDDEDEDDWLNDL